MLGTNEFISVFALTFSTFLPVINPFNGAMMFSAKTMDLSDRDRAFVCKRIAVYSLVLMLVCLTCGHLILRFFGISVGALRMAGGCVLFAAGWSALNAPSQNEDRHEVAHLSRTQLKSMAFYPFTLPLTMGPGAIAVSVALSASLPRDLVHISATLCAAVATVIVTWFCYRYSDRLSRAAGAAGSDALTRIFAFILICLGVTVCWQGFSELWSTLGTAQ